MHIVFLNSIFDIDDTTWDPLWSCAYPFVQHAFLAALEDAGCTTKETGWTPCHLLVQDNEQTIAAMPLFQKSHSYGEYVFDWAWADAYHKAGFEYYPILLNAIPFTPATGPRIAIATHLTEQQTQQCMTLIEQSLKARLVEIKGSGIHCLFPNTDSKHLLKSTSLIERQACQFHWFNQDFDVFSDFLNTFTSRKRKAIKRERKKVQDQRIIHQFRPAEDISPEHWQVFYALYQNTYYKRSGRPGYLTLNFFMQIAKKLPTQVLMATAHLESKDNEILAAALYFRDDDTLYGRYWGTKVNVDGLHFETCYYQGIEYAIEHKLKRFDSGAQGEHKIQRGFTPVITSSYHSLLHTEFQEAVKAFTVEEKTHNHAYCQNARSYLPFKAEVKLAPENILLGSTQSNPAK